MALLGEAVGVDYQITLMPLHSFLGFGIEPEFPAWWIIHPSQVLLRER